MRERGFYPQKTGLWMYYRKMGAVVHCGRTQGKGRRLEKGGSAFLRVGDRADTPTKGGAPKAG